MSLQSKEEFLQREQVRKEHGDPTGIKVDFDPTLQIMSGVTVHGNIPFEAPFITKVATNLWQGGCKNGLILPKFINHLVSLYPWERYKVKHELESILTLRMLDSANEEDFDFGWADSVAVWVNQCRKIGNVLVHCQAGLNRSSLIAARALILEGMNPQLAITHLRYARSEAVLCNPLFEKWLLK